MPIGPLSFVGVPQIAFKYVYFLANGDSFFGVELGFGFWEAFKCFAVGIELKIEAAF